MFSEKNGEKDLLGKKALVIGGSISGKLAARVLSDFFEEVIIVDKGQKGEKQFTRTGVPQSSQGHALLKSGEEILEKLFPGIVDELIADGSVKSDFANELAWNHHGKWKVKFHAGLSIIQQSRPFLECHIQRRLEMIPNISYLFNTHAKKLLMYDQGIHVEGLEVVKAGGPAIELKADFVIDASGAGSKTAYWIQQFGYDAPKETEIKVDLFYASKIYNTLSSNFKNQGSLLVYPNPPHLKRGGGLSQIENQRWMATLFGYGVQSVPRSEAEFIEYAKSLEQPDIYEGIKDAQPETDVSIYRFPVLRRFHFEKLNSFPNGLVVMGDAFCRIDPVFGQGMSIAAIEAMALKKELQKAGQKKEIGQISKRIHHRFSKIIDIPWLIALSEDFRYPHTIGVKPMGLSLLMWYVKKVILACSVYPIVYTKLINVLHLKAHPITLFAPAVLKAVLFGRRS